MAIVLDGTAGITTPDLTDTSLTSGRVVYAGASGNLTGASTFTFDGTNLSATGTSTFGSAVIGLAAANTDFRVVRTLGNSTFYAGVRMSGSGAFFSGYKSDLLVIECDPTNETAGSNIQFTVDNDIKATIPSTGGIQSATTISVGNATPSTSGAGITFPATQSASSNANTLDDYEEGTFTATLTCTTSGTITLNYNTLYYTKIGRQVTITGYLEVSSVSSPVGAVRLNGLPFTVANLNVQRVPLNVSTDGLTATAVTQIMGHLEENQTRGQINKFSAGTQSGLAGNVQAGTWFAVGSTYFTS